MVTKSRLLKTAFIIPLSMSLAMAPAWGFELKPDTDDTDYPTYTDSVITSDDDADGDSILIEGSPTGAGNAALLIDDNTAVILDGLIRIRDYDDDNVNTPITDAIGLDIDFDVADAAGIRLKSGGDIFIIEIRGPEYDGDDDGFADNDSDEDFISEGPQALAGNHTRIGLRLQTVHTLTGPLIGESGSQIDIEGNAANIGEVVGVKIDGDLINNLDLSTLIGVRGDKGLGVDINGTIGGYYRQRGAIDVRGEGSVGIDIGADITGSLMLDASVNATGFSTYTSGSSGAPSHGRDESELDTDEAAANAAERRRGGAAVNIDNNIGGGLIISGLVDRVLTDAETVSLKNISDARTDDDDDMETGNDITDQKTLPYHYDENRVSNVRLTSHGEADDTATLRINGIIGSDGSVETLLDTTNDDGDADTDAYRDGLKQFYFSHSFINRGTISANGLYDTFKADAVLLDSGATINGGILNSGSMSATAFNADATALIIDGATLNDGLRTDGSLLLNEGTISATVRTHTGADSSKTAASDTAIAIDLRGMTGPTTPLFVNRDTILAKHDFTTAATSDTAQTSVAGDNAIALDASQYNGDLNFTQEFLKEDELLGLGTQSTVNSAANPYGGSGDLDLDDNGDDVIDTRDGITVPRIVGDVLLTTDDNVFTISAGTVSGNINFGGGNDALNLSNEIQDDADDDYTAPITAVTGRIINSGGDLDISIGERTLLHLVGQEGDTENAHEALELAELNLTGELAFTVNADRLTADTPILNVTSSLTLADGAKITPSLTRLYNTTTTVDLINYADTGAEVSLPSDFLSNDDTPFVYNVTLDNSDNTISASFVTKTAAQAGLTNPTELAAYNAVLAHFSGNENLGTALTGIENEADFKTAYGQLFPHYSDGTAQQLSGLADMATGAVSQHVQLINADGRRGGDGWLQQFGDYRKQDAGSNGATVSGTSYAIALGYDLPVSIIDALGLYLQMGFTAVNEKSTVVNEVTSESITYGAYLSDKIGPFQYELNAAYGFVGLESFRLIDFSRLVERMSASWDATSTAASARLAYPILQDDHLLRLEAGVDYFNLAHDDFSETETVGYGFAMQVKGGESEKTSQFIGLRGGYRRGGDDQVAIVWEPNYYLGWRSTSEFTPYEASANFIGTDESFTLQSHIEPEDAIDIGLGLAAHNDYFAFEFNYRARIADDEETHGGGVSIRLLF